MKRNISGCAVSFEKKSNILEFLTEGHPQVENNEI